MSAPLLAALRLGYPNDALSSYLSSLLSSLKLIATATADRRGLINLGNTCYLNSVLQALSSCPSFRAYLGGITANPNPNLKGLQKQSDCSSSSSFSLCLLQCLDSITNHQPPFVAAAHNPLKLLQALRERLPRYRDRDQQDAEEVLREMLTIVHSEHCEIAQNEVVNSLKISDMACGSGSSSGVAAFPCVGTVANVLSCERCRRYRDSSHEPYYVLPLHLPNPNPPQRINGLEPDNSLHMLIENYLRAEELPDTECRNCTAKETLSYTRSKIALREMELKYGRGGRAGSGSRADVDEGVDMGSIERVHKYLAQRVIEGDADYCTIDVDDEMPLCSSDDDDNDEEGCSEPISELLVRKVRSTHIKRLSLARLPALLCLHINRNFYSSSGRLVKASTFVSFPATLAMARFLVHTPPPAHTPPVYEYSLRAVVCHAGSGDQGHYRTYCLSGGQRWLRISDRDVEDSTLIEVLRSQAYLLFYERV